MESVEWTQLGVLGAIVMALLGGLWKAALWLAENVAKPLVVSHTSLIEQLKSSDVDQTSILSRMSESDQEHSTILQTIADSQRTLADGMQKIDQEILATQRELLLTLKELHKHERAS